MNKSNTHSNERDIKIVHVWDFIVNDDFKEVIDITYTNKIYISTFGNLSLKDLIVKHILLEIIID